MHDPYAHCEVAGTPRVGSWDGFDEPTSPPPLPEDTPFSHTAVRSDARYSLDDAVALRTELRKSYKGVMKLYGVPWEGLDGPARVTQALCRLHLAVQKNDDVLKRWVMPGDARMQQARGLGLPRRPIGPEWLASSDYLPALAVVCMFITSISIYYPITCVSRSHHMTATSNSRTDRPDHRHSCPGLWGTAQPQILEACPIVMLSNRSRSRCLHCLDPIPMRPPYWCVANQSPSSPTTVSVTG